MELLRNLRMSTRLLFLYEVTTSRHTRLRTIGERLGMTIQGTSEYAHGLEEDGLLSFVNGEYRATKKGIEFLHDRMHELRGFVDRAGREMAFVETGEAAERGGNVIRLISETRVAEAVQAIEAANARLEDKIPYETVTLA